MDVSDPIKTHPRPFRNTTGARGSQFKNKQWVSASKVLSGSTTQSEGRWERGGHRGGKGRGGLANGYTAHSEPPADAVNMAPMGVGTGIHGPATQISLGPPKTWEELVKSREAERTKAIKEGKMDDPLIPKRLDEAITIVGTCQDMCPEFERYRRERENNLDKWECIMGPDEKPTKKVDHERAVKIYERGQGDKIIPSDLRPPPVLKRTLDYLFNDLIPRGGFAETQAFVRDRSRAVRNDFTIQQDKGPIAMECHERCTRYHILSLHLLYEVQHFDRAMEIQQLMNSLLSLKEFWEDQRDHYQSPNELEMRIYHRLGLIRDQHDRNDRTPQHVQDDPAFQLISRFRMEVQSASAPITKTSKMVVSAEAMQTFGELAAVLRERGNVVMIYLVACFLENIFGRDTIDDIESIRGDLSVQDIIDGVSHQDELVDELNDDVSVMDDDGQGETVDLDESFGDYVEEGDGENSIATAPSSSPLKTGATAWLLDNFGAAPTPPKPATSVFATLAVPSTSGFGTSSSSVFGGANTTVAPTPIGIASLNNGSAFGKTSAPPVFGNSSKTSESKPFGASRSVFGSNVFGGPIFGAPTMTQGSISDAPADISNQSAIPPRPPQTYNSLIAPSALSKQNTVSASEVPPLKSGDNSASSSQTTNPISTRPNLTLNPYAPSFNPDFSRSVSAPTSLASQKAVLNSTQSVDQSGTKKLASEHDIIGGLGLQYPSTQSLNGKHHSPLTINTKQARKGTSIDSPVIPPPLNRPTNISLPGTPLSANPAGPLTPKSSFSFPKLLFNNGASTPPGHLPPLFSHSPAPPASTTQASSSSKPWNSTISVGTDDIVISKPTSTNGTAGSIVPNSRKSGPDLHLDATLFAQRSSLVKEYFSRWKRRATDITAWKDACRRSEVYKQKVQQSSSFGILPAAKKRRVSLETSSDTTGLKRRTRRVVPDAFQSRTDEQLVQRFKENKEENERRWAKGSFVKTILEHLRMPRNHHGPDWRVWLCLNSENDRTAIWLEQKFDIPSSGEWESDSVFSLSISSCSHQDHFPGLIIFECIPLEDVKDELERKYHILDDCSRLRDILSSLPTDRHFVPSLLIINWADISGKDVPQDILDMANRHRQDQIIEDHCTFTIASVDGDLDEQFAKALGSLTFDMEGKRVERLNLEDLFERFSALWRRAVVAWMDACGPDDNFNWPLYNYVFPTFVKLLDAMSVEIMGLWEPTGIPPSPLPCPDVSGKRDAKSTHNALHGWLRSQQHQNETSEDDFLETNVSENFQAQAYLDHVCDMALRHIGHLAQLPMERRPVLKAHLSTRLVEFQSILDTKTSNLQSIARSLPRARSKRRPSGSDRSDANSRGSSLSPSSRYNTKRMKMSTPSSPEFSCPPSPTPSAAPSIIESTGSMITVAMLRALSRDVMKNYAGG